jgi:hypothetical protein
MDSMKSENFCPKCLQETLTDFVDEDTDVRHGAVCSGCGTRFLYVNGRLRELVTA